MLFGGSSSKLVELVQDAILAEIAGGKLVSGSRLPVESIGRQLGVSRGRLMEALNILRDLGVVCQGEGGALEVAPLDLEHVRDVYDVRAAIEGLAFRKAAERNPERAASEGPEFIEAGRRAVDSGEIADMIEADLAFHEFIYSLSCNPLLAPAMAGHGAELQRVMGEMLMRDADPHAVWDEHAAMLQAVAAGNPQEAEQRARGHIDRSAGMVIERLQRENATKPIELPRR